MPTAAELKHRVPSESPYCVSSFDLSVAAAGLVIAGLVKGITAIGYATCAMPFLTVALGLEAAIAIIVVPAIASNIAIIAAGRGLVPTAKRFGGFYVGILPGIVFGTFLLSAIDVRIATRMLGILTIGYVALAVARPQLSLPSGFERYLAVPAGVLNGILTGLTGSQIFPLVPYMLALRLEPGTQVQAINLAVTIASVALGVTLFGTGRLTPELLVLSCAAACLAVAGVMIGNAVRNQLPVEGIRRLTLAVLALIAASLLGRDVLDITVAAFCLPVSPDGPAVDGIASCFAPASTAAQ